MLVASRYMLNKMTIDEQELHKISNVDLLIKYLIYLIDYADLIYSQKMLSENSYTSLQVEIELFHSRVKNSSFIPNAIKTELSKIKLPSIKKEFSRQGIFRSLYLRWVLRSVTLIDEKIENQLRTNVKEFRDRLENFFSLIKAKS